MGTFAEEKRTIQRFGWKRDLPDFRDHRAEVKCTLNELPPRFDLRDTGHLDTPYDQGQLGSCTGNAIAAAVDFDNHLETGSFLTPSRLFIYFNERDLEGCVDQDSGAQIRDGIKSVAQLGVVPESEWPYNIGTFTTRPPANVYADALKDTATSYARVPQTLFPLKQSLSGGRPFVFGFSVFAPFMSDAVKGNGQVPMPQPTDAPLGGHAVLAVGYDDNINGGSFIVRNSWGPAWGDKGYFYLPYLYATNASLADDFWTITTTTITK